MWTQCKWIWHEGMWTTFCFSLSARRWTGGVPSKHSHHGPFLIKLPSWKPILTNIDTNCTLSATVSLLENLSASLKGNSAGCHSRFSQKNYHLSMKHMVHIGEKLLMATLLSVTARLQRLDNVILLLAVFLMSQCRMGALTTDRDMEPTLIVGCMKYATAINQYIHTHAPTNYYNEWDHAHTWQICVHSILLVLLMCPLGKTVHLHYITWVVCKRNKVKVTKSPLQLSLLDLAFLDLQLNTLIMLLESYTHQPLN